MTTCVPECQGPAQNADQRAVLREDSTVTEYQTGSRTKERGLRFLTSPKRRRGKVTRWLPYGGALIH